MQLPDDLKETISTIVLVFDGMHLIDENSGMLNCTALFSGSAVKVCQLLGDDCSGMGAAGSQVHMLSPFSRRSITAQIDEEAFTTNKIVNLELPDGLLYIGIAAFSNNQLSSVEIPNSVTTIEGAAFASNQLVSVDIGTGVTEIGLNAFDVSDRSGYARRAL